MAGLDADKSGQVGSDTGPTFQQECTSLQAGGFVVLKGRPCRIETSESRRGKHGPKWWLIGRDLFTGEVIQECFSTFQVVEVPVPVVRRFEMQLVDIEDDFCTLLNDEGATRSDLKLPPGELGRQIQQDFNNGKDLTCELMEACGEEGIVGTKVNTAP